MAEKRKPIVLAIVDGWGIAPDNEHNIFSHTKTPQIDRFFRDYPVMNLAASGPAVGLSEGMPGNAEIGHVNLGTGRVWHNTKHYIDAQIEDGKFFENRVLREAYETAKGTHRRVHVIGMLSTDVQHASQSHCYALLTLAKKMGVKDVALHVILDGIDAPHDAGIRLVQDVMHYMKKEKIGYVASVSGRFFAMDRDHYWNRTQRAYRAMVEGHADATFTDPLVYIQEQYDADIADADIAPAVAHGYTVSTDDVFIFFNTETSRMRQLVGSFVLPAFSQFERPAGACRQVITMRDYEPEIPVRVAYPARVAHNSLSQVLQDFEKKQMHIASIDRYPHVTYFFNGYIEVQYDDEVRILVDSQKRQKDTIKEITKKVIAAVETGSYDFVVCNFAAIDICAHTGRRQDTKQAITAVDSALGRIADYVLAEDGTLIITSSHGGSEHVQKQVSTLYNNNPVPCLIMSERFFGRAGRVGDPPKEDMSLLPVVGTLSDIAPTILKLMDIEKPEEMTGKSLI